MTIAEFITIIISAGVPTIGVIVWLVRLEAKANRNAEEIADNKLEISILRKRHEKYHDDIDSE